MDLTTVSLEVVGLGEVPGRVDSPEGFVDVASIAELMVGDTKVVVPITGAEVGLLVGEALALVLEIVALGEANNF